MQVKLTKRSQGTRRFTRTQGTRRCTRSQGTRRYKNSQGTNFVLQSDKAGALTMWSAGNFCENIDKIL